MKLFLGLVVVGWTCLPAGSQLFDASEGQVIPWPAGTWTGGTVARMVSGDFTGDLYRDVVVQDGSDLVLVFGAGVFQARSPLCSDVSDFCAVPTVTGPDAIVASDSQGWRKIGIDYGVSGYVQSVPMGNTAWIGARSLRPVINGNSPPQVVALDATGDQLLVLSNPVVDPTPDSLVVALAEGPGLALAVVDWNGDGVPEAAVLHGAGIDVYDIEADPPAVIDGYASSPLSAGTLVPFRQAGRAGELVAALVRSSSGTPELRIYADDGQGSVAMTVSDPYELAAGDVDGDGSDDLLLAHGDASKIGPMLYMGGCANGSYVPFCAPDDLDLGVPWPDPSGQAAPVLDDFTNDGDVDIVWYSEEEVAGGYEILRVAENSSVDHAQYFVGIQFGPSQAKVDPVDPAGRIGALRFQLAVPTVAPSFAADSILIEEWYQHAPTELQPLGAQAFTLAYPSIWAEYHELFLWPSWVPMNGVTHLLIRAVRTQSGEIVEAGPASLFAIVLTQGAYSYLQDVTPLTDFSFAWRDLTDPPPPPTPPGFPSGEFPNNSFAGPGIGSPVNLPPIEDGPPPKAAKTNP